jgi:hypothetical protein
METEGVRIGFFRKTIPNVRLAPNLRDCPRIVGAAWDRLGLRSGIKIRWRR